MRMPMISVIVPLYNEAENIELLCTSLKKVLKNLNVRYEVLYVDDGSEDATFSILCTIAARDPHIRIIKLRKNFGQTPAFAAGIDRARGEILITMDGDLQNDPADIPRLLDKLDEGYDVVVGWRYRRQDALITRKIPSFLANWVINRVTGIPVHDNGCSLKAFRGEVARTMPLYSDMHRFMPAAASISGARIAEIRVAHHPRQYGESKYGLSRIYKVILDLLRMKVIVSSASQVLRWLALLAAPFAVIGTLFLLYNFFAVDEQVIPTFSLVGAGLLFLALAMLLLLTGMLAELISYTTDNSQSSVPVIYARRLDKSGEHRYKGGS